MDAINKDAKYIAVGNVYIDCADIVNFQLLGYAPIDEHNGFSEPDTNKPVYRVIFSDQSYMDGIISKENIDYLQNYKNQDFTEKQE